MRFSAAQKLGSQYRNTRSRSIIEFIDLEDTEAEQEVTRVVEQERMREIKEDVRVEQ